MPRIGDYIDAGLNRYDPSPYIQAAWQASRSIGQSISSSVGAVGDAIAKRKEMKDGVKVNSELIDAAMKLYGDDARYLSGVAEKLKDEEIPLSQRHALGAQIGEMIGMGVEKQKNKAIIDLQTRGVVVDEGRLGLAERQYADLPVMQQQESNAVNEQAIAEAISIIQPLQEMEAPLAGKLPDMSGTEKRIIDAIESGDGVTALSAAKQYQDARLKQMEPYLGPPKLSPLKLGGTDEAGQPITIDAFVSPEGEVLDINRQPIGDGMVLPPKPGAAGIGVKPAAGATPKTPTEQALDEARLAEMQGKTAADVRDREEMASTAIAKSQSLLSTLDRLFSADKNPQTGEVRETVHPGFSNLFGSNIGIPVMVPGSAGADAKAIYDQLQGKGFIESIQDMKGMGALSNAEGEKASAAFLGLSTAMSENAAKTQILILKDLVRKGIERKRTGNLVNADGTERGPEDRRKSLTSDLLPPVR